MFSQSELKEAYKKLNTLNYVIDRCGSDDRTVQIGKCMSNVCE